MNKQSKWQSEITPQDLAVSATLSDLSSLLDVLNSMKHKSLTRLLDCGCGYGGLTMFVANHLGIHEVYGVDIDEKRLSQARQKGVQTYKIDLDIEKIPLPDEFLDVLTSFGMLEHLTYFDNFFIEASRVLRRDGYLLIAAPNLGSYVNRLALLSGFQPRDIEVSLKSPSQGFLPVYGGAWLAHIHSATFHAIKQILGFYGFVIVKAKGSSPYVKSKLIRTLDTFFSISPSLSRRFIVLSQKAIR